MPTLGERFKRSWNAFLGRDPTIESLDGGPFIDYYGVGSSYRPDRYRFSRNSAQSVVGFIYNRIAVDVAAISMRHVRLDDNDQFKENIDSYLNTRLTVEANIDQTARAFIQDICMSMFDEGVVAIIPVDCEVNRERTRVLEGKVYNFRTGRILAWYPQAVRVEVYNEFNGRREEIVISKTLAGIIENPFYAIMNEPNSTLQRLLRTVASLNALNDMSASDKLNLIIQLPYVIKSEMRKQQADNRRKQIEDQLVGSKYGIAYTDGTEKVIQLNRALDNNLWQQVKDLSAELYNQLGLTASIFDGTADEQTMINYYNRTIEPLCSAICDEVERKYLSETARTQKQAIRFFRDPFKLVPVSQLADIADKFSRNEILSSNELRAEVGYKPVDNERANALQNKNINTSNLEIENGNVFGETTSVPEDEIPEA